MTLSIESLSVEEVEALHEEQLRLFGGLEGVRDRVALESAVAMPSSTFGAEYLHPDPFEMAAAYAFHLSENQPFVDGNKRTALNAALVFLGLNGWDVDDPNEQLYDAMLGLAERRLSKRDLADVFRKLARPYTGDE